MRAESTAPPRSKSVCSRREFLKTSSAVVSGAALAATLATPRPGYTAEANTIKVALVGCGGRGTGAAANALSTKSGPVKLWAAADVFAPRVQNSLKALSSQFASQIEVPPERQFTGLDAFKKASDTLGRTDLVILATPPGFRPIHLEYAVQKGVNVFMEKSFAVDAPGVRRVLRAGEVAAQKNLKIAGGLMWRHDQARQAVIKRLHDGEIGEIHTLRTYRMHAAVGFAPKRPGMSELAHQISNYNSFTWLNGSFFVDWLIHNIDVCCWAKNAWPVTAQGMGGRQNRVEADQMWDHYMVEYTFADGAKLFAQGRHVNNTYDIFSDFAHGTKGSAVLMENLAAPKPRIYRNQAQTPANEVWRHQGPDPDPYQVEHDLLIQAIREDKPWNETERCAKGVLAAIFGRMAACSGQLLTWDQALASNLELAPGLERLTSLEDPAPVMPDANGRYPIPMPGKSKEL